MIKNSKLELANKRLWSAAASEARRRFPFDTIAASRFALPPHSIAGLAPDMEIRISVLFRVSTFALRA